MPLLGGRTLGELARGTFVFLEMAAAGLFVFGVAGMALAGMGLYGLVSYTVRQRTQEIGVRMALGAQEGEVIWHFLRGGLWLGGIGAAIGGLAALASTRLLSSVLYGVDSTDPACRSPGRSPSSSWLASSAVGARCVPAVARRSARKPRSPPTARTEPLPPARRAARPCR